MKKIISAMAMACLSFSCFAESYFVKVADNEYVLQHGKASKDLGTYDIGIGRLVSAVDEVYTPTHIFTYPDGNPAHFRNIQKIDYTESKVTFVKDIKSRKCCIDIYDDEKNPNKCRIIGVNGHNITGKDNNNFEVYDVAEEANSFTDSKQRLIYVDHSGLYIVEKDKNAVEDISKNYIPNGKAVEDIYKNYIPNGKFGFNGEIIKISAIDGKREMLGFDENKKAIFAFNCPSDTPVSFGIEATPFMKQIEEITGVKLVTPPPSKESALKRMAEILDVPEEVLVFDDGMVKLAKLVKILADGSLNTSDFLADNPLTNKLKVIIGVSIPSKKSAITKGILEKVRNYKFDTSDEAKKRRKEIALKPWDE